MASIDMIGIYFALVMTFIIIFALSSSAIHYYKIKYIHESGIAILLGLFLSFIIT